ncbi:hypothetical protein [Bacillus cereus]|nr:hypothetical protein [Bacillus cereus]
MSYETVAKELGTHHSVVSRWVNTLKLKVSKD